MTQPVAIDLFCGLGGWTDGLLAEGYFVAGFDIEQHVYGEARYPGNLVLQDVLTLHGSQFRNAALIVASPPCQAYSYRAMPWKRAKALPPPDNTLFDACFRIQREACEAAGRHVPLIVENVRGAQKWVGRARFNYGSFYLWGDVPALMPTPSRAAKVPGFRFDGSGKSFQSASVEAVKVPGLKDGMFPPGGLAQGYLDAKKVPGLNWSGHGTPGYKAKGFNVTAAQRFREGVKQADSGVNAAQDGLGGYGGSFGWNNTPMRHGNSRSDSRKAASAMIAKIPLPLSMWIAATFKPRAEQVAA